MADDAHARPFRPRPMLQALEQEGVTYVVIGGTAAVIGGATHVTFDLDITPARDEANLDRLAAALRRLNAQVYGISPDAAASFQLDGRTLAAGSAWKFLTEHGELDVSLDPDGTHGYSDLQRNAVRTSAYGIDFRVAALEDVIRSKEAANRPRDRAVLPDLRRALELRRRRERLER
jgi:hypothetical protein